MAELSDAALSRVAPGWRTFLAGELAKPYMSSLVQFLRNERQRGRVLFPPPGQVLRALAEVDLEQVRVVILGQDPYHGPGQANGMCFAVNEGQALPPSLRNIFAEMAQDMGVAGPFDATLSGWAQQGVLLLNAVLSVESGKPLSHRGRGWETFTAAVVDYVNSRCDHVVFVLWGSSAAAHRARIDELRHFVIQSPHPSPLSAHRGFFGSRPFSQANAYLIKCGRVPIDWAGREKIKLRPGVGAGGGAGYQEAGV